MLTWPSKKNAGTVVAILTSYHVWLTLQKDLAIVAVTYRENADKKACVTRFWPARTQLR